MQKPGENVQSSPGSENLLPWLTAASNGNLEQLKATLANERAAKAEACARSEHTALELERAKVQLRQLRLETQHFQNKPSTRAEKERRLRQEREAISSAAKLKTLEKQLSVANSKIQELNQVKSKTRGSSKVRISLASFLVIVVGAAITQLKLPTFSSEPQADHNHTSLQQPVNTSRSQTPWARSFSQEVDSPSSSVDQEKLNRSLTRLETALSTFSNQSAQELMDAVNAKQPAGSSQVCAFQWRNGGPALSLEFKHGKLQSLDSSLNQCASAIEHFR